MIASAENNKPKTLNESTAIKVHKISSFSKMQKIANEIIDSKVKYYFRGHASPEWRLENTIHRLKEDRLKLGLPIPNEVEFIKQFQFNLPAKNRSKTLFETMATMQHLGIPTRMLDFTMDFWVATFFATTIDCYNSDHKSYQSIVYIINPEFVNGELPDIELEGLKNFSEIKKHNITYPLYRYKPVKKSHRIQKQKGTFLFMHDPFENLEWKLAIDNNWNVFYKERMISDPHKQFLRSTSIQKVELNLDATEYMKLRKYLYENHYNYQHLFGGVEGKTLQIKHGVF